MQKGGIKFADHDLSEVYSEVLPGHVKRPIVRVPIIVISISELLRPL